MLASIDDTAQKPLRGVGRPWAYQTFCLLPPLFQYFVWRLQNCPKLHVLLQLGRFLKTY